MSGLVLILAAIVLTAIHVRAYQRIDRRNDHRERP